MGIDIDIRLGQAALLFFMDLSSFSKCVISVQSEKNVVRNPIFNCLLLWYDTVITSSVGNIDLWGS